MRIRDIPVVSHVFESGADDRVFDSLVLLGLPLIVLIAGLGRSLWTELLAGAYLVMLIGYVVYRSVA